MATIAPSLLHGFVDLGSAPTTDRVVALVGLRIPNAASLAAFDSEVSDPASPAYGQYLTPEQFRARYSPPPSAANAVAAWLRSAGLHITEIPSNRLYVAVTGTVAQAERAFGTTIRRVRTRSGGVVEAAVRAASAPVTVSRLVSEVRGLDTGDVVHPLSAFAPPAFVNGQPCSTTWAARSNHGAPAVMCGYVPSQLEAAYGVAPAIRAGIDGTGVRVAIIDPWSNPRMAQDIQTYSARHGLPRAKFVELTNPIAAYVPSLPGGLWDPDGATGEEALDVEAVHTMAPGATIVYDAAMSLVNVSLQQTQNDVVNNHRAQIVSNSYGSNSDSADTTSDSIFMQAAAEGIGFYFSSGDGGDETRDPNGPGDRETNSPANDPWVTAVGGTSLGVGPGGKYLFETYWGTSTQTLQSDGQWGPATFSYGGGGGTSQAFGEPAYQKGIVPEPIANYWFGKPPESGASSPTLVPGRAVPDVSMVGDTNTGFLIGLTEDFTAARNPNSQQLPTDDVHYGEYRLGGTSLSCPLFAGVMALADQAAGHPHGFANPAIYGAYRHDHGIVHDPHNPFGHTIDVVRVNNNNNLDPSGGTTTLLRSFDDLLTLSERPGYDDSTGLGTPNGLRFLSALAPNDAALRQ